jgi:hypothetical protein
MEGFLRELGLLVVEYQQTGRSFDVGRDRSIAYGNVRYRQLGEGSGPLTVGIIYETPGGSTNQINIEYDQTTGVYSLPHSDSSELEFESDDEAAVLEMVRTHVDEIPDKRKQKLHDYVDSKVEEGRPREAIFEWLNDLLHQDLKGGRITHDELAEGCQYVVARMQAATKGEQAG